MTSQDEQLARRALACPGWRRTRGMRGFLKTMVLRLVAYPGPGGLTHTLGYVDDGEPDGPDVGPEWLPDFSDRATLGCLEGLVGDAWGSDVYCDRQRKRVSTYAFAWGPFEVWRALPDISWEMVGSGPTKAAALVAALEAAPTRTLAGVENFSREETAAISASIEAETAADMEGRP